ncbi:MAG: efflux transporter periplasmic adaptor subunit [Sphingobacteriales bacterium 17-39-43]|uniref:efflux RND transporter periplasmic adaptor subunit n=1 Tax=Daejeonella sp. TaxID=2805397 RepID=UPI000BC93FDC|nr:efflux RND transporter periplasmic adaptor subunit [Daejeonella sp.]OYY05975.1 MAG: efflux transporter periplasmic adaptor subunit [Sphingobacteriia bacterium 35-40-5]OYZ30998.1 MAG: efflux transporter periplasmic adaptor subunit [Sphingobacteriales bacterium 16-39-50]OZA23775.1 MAG: efflux transporter periplasmic adaptor subunit [Sphingobacteriales bacterium 17-39-43]OZA61905.1 MAG: efflux transporter periplasmic adaptor subunit [Sphingobacteriales bacterium 39-40-5]HQS06598.1 efflux RND t
MKKILIPILILGALSFLASCGESKKETIKGEPAVAVKLGGSSSVQSADFISASGKIEAENSANISTRMMGYITRIHVKVGQQVKQGQLLLSINSSDLTAKKAQVDASILQATTAYNSARKDYDRFVNLFKEQSASQKELDDITARYEMAIAALEGAKQMKKEVMAQFSYSNITAPFSGVITNTFAKEGDMANPGMPLLGMEGSSRLQVSAMVSENQISGISKGMPARVLIKSLNREVEGMVSEVSISAKNTGGQYLVKIDLDKIDKSILSGMFVNVQFPVKREVTATESYDKVLIPVTALVKQGQLKGVYTIGNGNTAILRWVKTGKTSGDQVEVLSGLSSSEEYVVTAEGKLYNGARVSIQQ